MKDPAELGGIFGIMNDHYGMMCLPCRKEDRVMFIHTECSRPTNIRRKLVIPDKMWYNYGESPAKQFLGRRLALHEA